ncbi:sigma-70 family RNA polymerase sigma factor [bacterium]|nr:sigma-70 family RNA polymerase sigma factor [bacterium]
MDTIANKQMTDEVIFEQYKQGDTRAIEVIIDRYKKPIYSFLLCKCRNRAEADDVFQDVFYKIIDNPHGFRSAISFKAWLFTLARNTYVDHLRKKIRKSNHVPIDEPKNEGPALNETLPDDGPTLEEWVGGQKISEVVDSLMGTLPEEQKESFYLRIRMEMQYEEIAQMMDCSVNTVKSRVRYALETIKDLLVKRGVRL